MRQQFISSLTGCIYTLFLLLHSAHSFYGRCREQPISCFHCDSRFQPNCADPFHHSLAVFTKNCQGCCTKSTYIYPEYYVVRTCADFGDTRIFDFDLSCEEKNRGEKKCYCNDNLCNGGHSLNRKRTYFPFFTGTLGLIVCFRAYISQYFMYNN